MDSPIIPARRTTRGDRIMQGLAALQLDVEQGKNETLKRQRRAVLRGMRAGLWADGQGLTIDEVLQGLRAELFGWPLRMLPVHDDGEPVPMGTTTEVEGNE